MFLYKIMIVDDEESIREGIRQKIDWKRSDFELVATAGNGQEALELAQNLHPDVVMTDIKMPFMDGLELCERLHRMMPDVKLVIFTGFDDFEYAQKAIKVNVTEYVLKPIDSQELIGVLNRVKDKLDNEFAQKCNIKQLSEQYERSLPILREQFFNRLFNGNVSEQWILEQAGLYKISFAGSFWAVALVEPHYGIHKNEIQYITTSRKELIPHMIKQLIEENLSPYCSFKTTLYQDFVAVLAMLSGQDEMVSFINGMDQVCKQVQRYLLFDISAGIGSLCTSLSSLWCSVKGAKSALRYCVLAGSSGAIYIDDMEPKNVATHDYVEYNFNELISAIIIGDSKEITNEISRFLSLFYAKRYQLLQYQLLLMELITELLKIIRDYHLESTEFLEKGFDSLLSIADFNSLEELKEWLQYICNKINRLIRQERMNMTKRIAEEAKQYIQAHYSDTEMSLEKICSYLHLSTSHFSTLFKRETGISFASYLTQVRLNEAVKLLNTTECLLSEIAQKVGYNESTYFSYVFKKQFGMSPVKYRSRGVMKCETH